VEPRRRAAQNTPPSESLTAHVTIHEYGDVVRHMRAALVFSCLVLAAALAAVAHAADSRTTTCRAKSIGPGALAHGSTAGAECMLRAYVRGCTSAEYELSSFGVDTVATLRFQLVRRSGVCAIDLTRSFRVVPQKPHVTATARCKALRRTAADIVATGCTGRGFTATVSLTR
jgi:hypothetical protein